MAEDTKNIEDIIDELSDIYTDDDEVGEGEKDDDKGEKKGEGEGGGEGEGEGKGEGEGEKKKDDLAERIAKGEEHLQNLNKAIAEANRTLHNLRQEKKTPAAADEVPLTNAQLLKLMEDAKGDNETLLQIIKYTAEQAAKGAKKDAVAETDIIKKRDESIAALRGLFKEGYDDPETLKAVDDVKDYYGITDHPFGDIFARGVLTMKMLPMIVESWKAKLAELDKKGKGDAEKARQDKIASQGGGSRTKGSGGGGESKNNFGLSAEQLDVARRLGYNTPEKLKRYAAIVVTTNKEKAA